MSTDMDGRGSTAWQVDEIRERAQMVPDVGVCCKVTLREGLNPAAQSHYVDAGTLGETVEDALRLLGCHDRPIGRYTITLEPITEGHDA